MVAAIFQGINKRLKNDTPYINTLMLISWALFLHLIQLMAIFKKLGYDILGSISKGIYVIAFILFMTFSVLSLIMFFPKKIILSTVVKSSDSNRYFNGLILYFIVSICILIFLL